MVSWLYDQETMGIKFGLSNISEILHMLGDRQEKFRSVHIAGTKGKGSVSAMAASILRQSGYRTALYTSPHLVDFRERMQVNGEMITCQDVLRLGEEIRSYNEKMIERSKDKRMTFFELTTAMAFAHFAERGAEEAVIEVGMGGRS